MNRLLFAFCTAMQLSASAQFAGMAPTPPMGWNSWNAFGLNINSAIVKAVADSMVSKGLKTAGYEYIVIDDGWQIARDKAGKIIADSTRFPEGIKYLADYVHSRGLKFGIYTCCGTMTCGGRPGSYGYEEIDAKTYAEWGVDFIKEDWCFTAGLDTRVQYKKMSDAIRATGRPMLLSLCEWGVSAPWEWASGTGAMWRTTSDIQDCFDCVRNWGGMGWVPIIEKNGILAPYASPGNWNDPDMLEVGNKGLNAVESRAHFSMWCMMAAPLIAGNNISTMNDSIRDILTAPEIIAIDQDRLGIQGTRVKNENGLQVWQKSLADGSIAVALLNISESPATISVSLEELGLKKGKAAVRDLWSRKDLPVILDTLKAAVEPHGIVVVKLKGEKAPVSLLKFNQPDITMENGNHQLIQIAVAPLSTPLKIATSDEKNLPASIAGVHTFKLSAKRQGTYTIRVTTMDDKMSAISKVHVVPSSIRAPWKFNDIRNDKGSATFKNGTFTIEGAGADIWDGNDQFAFVSRPAADKSAISAKIMSLTNSDPWAKTGIMFRETLASNSRFVLLCATPGNGLSLQWRDSTGRTCDKKDLGGITLPSYLKLVRNGNNFSAFKSTDGKSWERLGDISLTRWPPDSWLAGMAVCSHSGLLINRSTFSNVKVGWNNSD